MAAIGIPWDDLGMRTSAKSIHDLRVATRKHRATLLLLDAVTHDKRIGGLQKDFKKLRKRLGPLRDVQVQRALLREWKKIEAVQSFRKSLKREEKRRIEKVEDHRTGHQRKKLDRRMKKIVSAGTRSAARAIQRGTRTALNAAHDEFTAALKEFSPRDTASLHPLRIAAKNLRYLTESAQRIFGIEPKDSLERLQRIQKSLGDIRDLQILEKTLRKEKDPQLDKVCTQLARRRAAMLKKFSV